MPDPVLNVEAAASAVALSALYGNKRAAEKLGIDEKTLTRYRAYFADHPGEQPRIDEKRKLLERDWAENLTGAIAASVDFLQRAAVEADPKDPDAIHSVAGALKILSEVTLNKRILDARLARQGGTPREAAGSDSRSNGTAQH